MRTLALGMALWVGLCVAVPQVRGELALTDQDRVVFFGNKVFGGADIPVGVESFLRVRYPELKARFRTFGRHEDAILKNVLERFDKQVGPYKPTVVVLAFATDDVPRAALDPAHLDKFKADFAPLVDRAKGTGARVYIMTPLCPEPAKGPNLAAITYDETLGKYAEAMRTIAQEKGAKVVDWYATSKQYAADHAADAKLAVTTDGSAPSVLGLTLAMTTLLEAWGAEPYHVKITGDWTGPSVTASMGQASVTKVGEDRIQIKLTGVPLPWVIARRGPILGNDWPGSKLHTFTLQMANAPEGGVVIGELYGSGDKAAPRNEVPFLTQQLLEGTDLSFVGPLTKLDALTVGLGKWLLEACRVVAQQQDFMAQPIPEPEYKQAYETYYLGLAQLADATDLIILRQPTTMDVTLELYKAPTPPQAMPQPTDPGSTSRPARRPPPMGPKKAPTSQPGDAKSEKKQ